MNSEMKVAVASRKRSDFDYSGYFREMRLIHDLTILPGDRRWRAVPPTRPEPHKVVLYLGCNVLRTSHMVSTISDILDLLGVDYVAVGGPAYCCGIVHHRYGDTELSQAMGANAVRYLERFEPERVLMWCPSCIYFYDEVFQVPASFQTQHVTEFLVEQLAKLRFVRELPKRVALHYHCNRPRRLQEAQAAETLLAAVPGLKMVKLDSDMRLDRSCSELLQQTLGLSAWQEIVEGQVSQALEGGADTFATLYHGCQRLICSYEERYPLTFEHYLTVFARALGIEHEDKYKKYRLWRDPQRVLAEMAPCMQANGVREQEAQLVVRRTFPEKD
ncbi:MAG: (Fe-S)-binding protein [Chloroflexi bacterium]|nr:(Fe-S)-binding protein [Chloroflexota bacterium]